MLKLTLKIRDHLTKMLLLPIDWEIEDEEVTNWQKAMEHGTRGRHGHTMEESKVLWLRQGSHDDIYYKSRETKLYTMIHRERDTWLMM